MGGRRGSGAGAECKSSTSKLQEKVALPSQFNRFVDPYTPFPTCTIVVGRPLCARFVAHLCSCIAMNPSTALCALVCAFLPRTPFCDAR